MSNIRNFTTTGAVSQPPPARIRCRPSCGAPRSRTCWRTRPQDTSASSSSSSSSSSSTTTTTTSTTTPTPTPTSTTTTTNNDNENNVNNDDDDDDSDDNHDVNHDVNHDSNISLSMSQFCINMPAYQLWYVAALLQSPIRKERHLGKTTFGSPQK